MKRWTELRKRLLSLLMLMAAALLLTGCFGRSSSEEEAEGEEITETADPEEQEEMEGEYAGTVAAREAAADESPYYGIMYATILDINGSGNDSSTVYSFKDKSDPDNAWSVTGLEVGDIETELKSVSTIKKRGTPGVAALYRVASMRLTAPLMGAVMVQ